MKRPVVTSCLHQNTFNAELHRRESLNQMAMVKGRLEPRTSVPCCLSPPASFLPVSGLSLFIPHLPDTLTVVIEAWCSWMSRQGCSGGRRQDAQKWGEEQGSSCLGAALHLEPESRDQIPVCRAQASSPLIGLLPHPLPGYRGPGTHVLCPLFICIFVL